MSNQSIMKKLNAAKKNKKAGQDVVFGTKKQTYVIKDPVWLQLRLYAGKENLSFQKVVDEALDLWFADRGAPSTEECLEEAKKEMQEK